MLPFVLLLLATLTLYHFTKEREGFATKERQQEEGFADSQKEGLVVGPAAVKQPTEKVVQRLSSLPAAPPAPSSLLTPSPPSASSVPPAASSSLVPGPLPTAPFEQTAAMSPLPYQDTAAVKANRQQLLTALEMLKGFLAYEAPHLEERSDPAVQLPLQTARSDFFQLQNEVSVLNRNPGIQPTIPLTHLNDISANLAFLQQKVRLLGTAGALQGPIYAFHDEESVKEGFTATPDASLGQVATEAELVDFLAKVEAERARLAASATTDPVTQGRVRALTEIRQTVRAIVEQLRTKKMLPTEVPIFKSDLDKAFPVLGKPSEPLPQLVRALQLPPGLANLLPSNVRKDPETTRQIAQLVDKYADTIVNGLSARFEVAYTPPALSERARRTRSTLTSTGFPSMADLDNVSQTKFMPRGGDHAVTDRLAALPQEAGRGPSSSSSSSSAAHSFAPARFDWKERARQIEDQIRKRGLRPADFGVMPREQKVSNDFSWKGYAKMLCTRLQATMDPALPETCGCPPMDWKGWRG